MTETGVIHLTAATDNISGTSANGASANGASSTSPELPALPYSVLYSR